METILTTRRTDCSKLTRDEFIKLMTQDLEDARQKYHDVFYPEEYSRFLAWNECYRDSTLKNAKTVAEKKWKTEKRRQQYIDEKMKECNKYIATREFKFYTVTFFDFDVEPGKNGISENCIIEYDKEEKLGRCYDMIKDNKYFKNAKGWRLIDRHHSRPYVHLILPDALEKEYVAEADALYRDITEFYRNCSIKD